MPILTGFLIVSAKFAESANRIPWYQFGQSLVFSTAIGIIAIGIFSIAKQTRKVSGIIGSVFVIITMLWMWFNWTILPTAIILFTIVLAIRLKENKLVYTNTIVMSILIFACTSSLAIAGFNSINSRTEASNNPQTTLTDTPNIYFIIPDRFPSQSALMETGYDNSEFIQYLENEDFYTKSDQISHDEIKPDSNRVDTSRTPRFVSSVLNLGTYVDLNTPYNVISRMIKYHEVGKILKSNGYTYYHIGTWWAETEVNEMADVNYVFKSASLMPSGELPVIILDRSIFRYLTTYPMQIFRAWNSLDDIRREQHLFQLESFKEAITDSRSPKFIFVHLILPHPPYLWTADGKPQTDINLTDEQQYIEQIKFTQEFLKEFINATSESDIIIIQSDEGMGYVNKDLNQDLSNNQWNGVLSAWKIPNVSQEEMTKINHTEVLKLVIESLQR